MKTSFGILKRDLLALAKNPIALLVVGALLVLPGLYAWYCIVANWDPYANTNNMPIAVVNQDQGATSTLTGDVNIGKQVVQQLEDNDSIDWRFYDTEDEALNDTRMGVVYATLVLPSDLSRNVTGIFEDSSERPTVLYYPNEKYNAVATKVTDSAAQTLVQQINQGFSSTVNQKILESAQDISNTVEHRASQVNESAIAQVKGIQADLERVIASLDDVQSSLAGWRSATAGATSAMQATAKQLPEIRAVLNQSASQLSSLRTSTGTFESQLSSTILGSASTVSELSAQANSSLSQATKDLQAAQTSMQALQQAASGNPELEGLALQLNLIISVTEGVLGNVGSHVSQMDQKVQGIAGNVKTATSQLSGEVVPQLGQGATNLTVSLSGLSSAVNQFEPQIGQILDVLAQTDSALVDASGAVEQAKELLSTISANLKATVTDIGAIGNALRVDELADLLDTDPTNLGSFISSPVHIVTEKVFPVSNYGTAVAPFYTNLALWIGCFILASLMKVEIDRTGFEEASSRQRYFGRWLLFVLLALLQSQVICAVDILLGIDCARPALFMLAGAVCSFAYMNLIYALVKMFRNIGKTLCILLLIMQVPGSSGMYPIEMMPGFFRVIHPVLPFTYGIDAMREALCGMHGLAYFGDLAILALIVPISLALGLLLRPAMANLLVMFDEELNAAGFFASEEHSVGEEARFRGMMRTLSAHSAFGDDLEERAWRLKRSYPHLRRAGSIASFAVPFGFLALMLILNLALPLGTNVKLAALIVMLVALLVVSFGLIILEYMQRTITEETRLLGAAIIGDDWDAATTASPNAADAAAETEGGNASRMGPARDIFATDMRLGFQSVAGIVVITLLVITPSLYAWFNIAGSWDPYSATGNLKVAVANEDQGYKGDLIPVTINVGDTIVSQLRGNSSFNWEFVSEDEAIDGVESSQYYAAIVIPPTFSRTIMTYLTTDADYPDVVYYTNEKENPIAPIITQKGASAIQESIRVNFTKQVDAVALSVAYDLLSYLTNPNISGYAAKMSAHLDDATHDAGSAARELRMLAGLTKTTTSIVNGTQAALDGMKDAARSAESAIGDAKGGLADASAALERALGIVRNMMDDTDADYSSVKEIIDAALDLLDTGSSGIADSIQDSIDELQAQRDKPETTDEQKARCDAAIADLNSAKRDAQTASGNAALAREKLAALAQDASAELTQTRAFFNDTVIPSVAQLRSSVEKASASTSEVIEGLKGALGGVEASTSGLSNQLTSLSVGLAKAADTLEASAANIQDIKQRVAAALKSGNVQQIKDIVLGNDPETMAASLAVPLHTERQPLYSVSNYGSAMAPFYTVLALWVGALVMISTMRIRLVEERLEELRRKHAKVLPRHEFFGRYGIFGFVGLLQSTLVLLGDLLFLHIQCENPVAFFLLGLFVGQIFCIIVYTITELFGDVGKALCVILLIMQVAASGGTFPVEMLAPVLYSIVDFLPFYHAMTLLQECVAGIFWPQVLLNVLALATMAGVMVVLGLPLRRPFRKVNTFFEEQLEKTGYM